jgi:hypothetical protein
VEDLLRYAALAPSQRPAQPWRFAIVPQGIEIFAGGADRESLMSAGAAITCLRVAAAHFGFDSSVLYQRAQGERPTATLVRLQPTLAPDPSLARLFPALARQHTNRDAFDGEPIDPQPLSDLCDLLDAHAGALRLVLPRDWRRVAEMAHGANPASHASMFVVVTATDDAVALLKAGELAERLLLTVTLAGLEYSFLNEVVDDGASRDALRALIHSPSPPQMLLLIGHVDHQQRSAHTLVCAEQTGLSGPSRQECLLYVNARDRRAPESPRTTSSRPDSSAAAR